MKNYYLKYLKYKTKYLILKGGARKPTNEEIIKTLLPSALKINNCGNIKLFLNFLDYSELNKEANEEHKKALQEMFPKNPKTILCPDRSTLLTILKSLDVEIYNALRDTLEWPDPPITRKCTISELMGENKPDTIICNNPTTVTGSCSHPPFWGSNNDISVRAKTYWNKFINKLYETIKGLPDSKKPNYIDFVIGGTELSEKKTEHINDEDETNLTILVEPSYTDITNMEEFTNYKNGIIYINESFPLSHNFTNSKSVLDNILKLHTQVPVRITNRICGSCFRSFYYLTKIGIKYIVNPVQSVSVADTTSIKNCFR